MKVASSQINAQAYEARNLEQTARLFERAVAEEAPDFVALPELLGPAAHVLAVPIPPTFNGYDS